MVGVLFLKIVWWRMPSQVDSCKGTTTLAGWQCWVAWWSEPPVQTGNGIITRRLCHSSCCRTLRPLFCYWNDCVALCTQQNSANLELVWGAEVPEPQGGLHCSIVVPCAHAWKLWVFQFPASLTWSYKLIVLICDISEENKTKPRILEDWRGKPWVASSWEGALPFFFLSPECVNSSSRLTFPHWRKLFLRGWEEGLG